MNNHVIPAEAVEVAQATLLAYTGGCVCHEGYTGRNLIDPGCVYHDVPPEVATRILEAAAPHMLVTVHHHDIEHHARSFNEGYETAMAQELAEDPTIAQDWLDEKLTEAKAEALEDAAEAWQVRMDTIGRGSVEAKAFMQMRAVTERQRAASR